MEKFSCVLIAKNEADVLPRLLASLSGIEDVILVDTGSTDGTPEIARNLGCRVEEVGGRFLETPTQKDVDKFTEWVGFPPSFTPQSKLFNYSAARNYAMTLAENDWCFQSDADEVVEWDLEKVYKLLPDNDHLVYRFCFAYRGDGKCGLEFSHSKFFRRSKVQWVKKVHEVHAAREGCTPKPPIYTDAIYLKHYQKQSENRTNYLPKLEYAIVDDKCDRNLYYLTREYMYVGEYEKFLKMFEIYKTIGWWKPEVSQAHIYASFCAKQLGKEEESERLLFDAIRIDGSRREPFWELGELYKSRNDLQRAVVYLEAALAIPFNPNYYLNNKVLYEGRIEDELALIYDQMGNKSRSLEHWKRAVAQSPDKRMLSNFGWFYPEVPLVSIVIPTSGRAESLDRLLKSIKDNTLYPNYEVVLMFDGDAENYERLKSEYPNSELWPKVGAVRCFNYGVERANGELIVYLANDCEVTLGWLINAYIKLKDSFKRDGLVILNDGYWNGHIANHFLCTKSLKNALGGEIWHSGYNHWGVDDELKIRLEHLGLVEFAEGARIIHHHYHATHAEKRPMDALDISVLKKADDDRKLLKHRMYSDGLAPNIIGMAHVHNEEKNVAGMIQSMLKVCSEIYIIDHGSTDKTIEICRSFYDVEVKTSEIVHDSVNGYDDGAALNETLAFARTGNPDWILWLDADERIEEAAENTLWTLAMDSRYDAFTMQICTFWMNETHYRVDGDFGYFYIQNPPWRFFRNTKSVHFANRKVAPGPPEGIDRNRIGDSGLRIKHYSFPDRETALAKYERYRGTVVDSQGIASVHENKYGHLHPDYTGVQLVEWK